MNNNSNNNCKKKKVKYFLGYLLKAPVSRTGSPQGCRKKNKNDNNDYDTTTATTSARNDR